MRIGLINENSQASKNAVIFKALKEVTDEKGYEAVNFGMYGRQGEPELTYVQNGLLASILLNTHTVDFIITGCGTGEGAINGLNAFPGVMCGWAVEPTDAYLFTQINDGNALSLPFAKGFGWGAELNLKLIFERLFAEAPGSGYPKERAVPEQRNAGILKGLKKDNYKPLIQILKEIDQDFLKETVSRQEFKDYFTAHADEGEIKDYVLKVCSE
ncbi:RpiB/LacA/LacB family sugar-phosphate isomerase [Bifidobacterium sp. ESL0763]|uniref:RpiB/LacA/LacB family sugar-phosphate isomerase n=1 Tax=Bifidobacterium sp. ESL0763 TaxID=2983227 RepID=UPI0023F73A6E|nr:RpiB/LacA/LacB family sugar-phosphate isomerase [Bifidobacterium sp. ESL0763]MDF7664272.1 RpiB/LacA/LacB family sugar-phosphate isomerase [Bifidobacterium sp. ESL0763]